MVTDGTAVLGLGDIGPAASMPVMEGKAVLFKQFGGVDAIPVALDTTDVDEIVETIVRLAPTFGGINLEDISSPRCFEIERRLIERLDIPVFHDDQHGTAVVTLAALFNALRVTDRDIDDVKVVISGAGAAGVAITKILKSAGVTKIAIVDRSGVVHPGRGGLDEVKHWLADATARVGPARLGRRRARGADVFIGVSGGTVPEEAVASMAPDAIVFALANPHPEVHPDVANKYARVVATGRSDFPNQINNVLVFPGIFRGALDVRATRISEGMKLAAAKPLPTSWATTSPSRSSSRRRSTPGSLGSGAGRHRHRAARGSCSSSILTPDHHREELDVRRLRRQINPDARWMDWSSVSAPNRRCPTGGRLSRSRLPRSTTTTYGACAGSACPPTGCR